MQTSQGCSDRDIFLFFDKVFDWNHLVDTKPVLNLSNVRKIWQAELQHVQSSKGSDRCLAWYRLVVAVAAPVYFVLVVVFSGPTFLNYLTNWGNTMMVLNFCVLALGHAL